MDDKQAPKLAQPQQGSVSPTPSMPAFGQQPANVPPTPVGQPSVAQPTPLAAPADPTTPAMPTLPAPSMPLDPIPTTPPEEETSLPVANVIGEIASQPEVDSTIPGIGEDKPADSPSSLPLPEPTSVDAADDKPVADSVLPEPDRTPAPAEADTTPGQQVSPTPDPVPDASPTPANPQPGADSHTVKLPVPTSMLPALAVGALVFVLLLAVGLYAFL